jgi:hypothetical protein
VGALTSELPLLITGDNRLWIAGGSGNPMILDLDRGNAQALVAPGVGFRDGPWGAVSGDGRRMMMVPASNSSGNPMLWLDAADGQVQRYASGTQPQFFYRMCTDRKGTRWMHEGYAGVGFDLTTLGLIKTETSWLGVRCVASRDGSRVYVYALHENAIGTYSEPTPIVHKPRIYVLDTSQPMVTQTHFPVLGFFELDHYPTCRVTQGPTTCEPYGAKIALSNDDRTLFAVGDRNFIVAPVPLALRPPPGISQVQAVAPWRLKAAP